MQTFPRLINEKKKAIRCVIALTFCSPMTAPLHPGLNPGLNFKLSPAQCFIFSPTCHPTKLERDDFVPGLCSCHASSVRYKHKALTFNKLLKKKTIADFLVQYRDHIDKMRGLVPSALSRRFEEKSAEFCKFLENHPSNNVSENVNWIYSFGEICS